MGDITKNFSKHEFECNCGCGLNKIWILLVEALQNLRDAVNDKYAGAQHADFTFKNRENYPDEIKFHINSGCRCYSHNLKPVSQGGAGSTQPQSWHVPHRLDDYHVTENLSRIVVWNFHHSSPPDEYYSCAADIKPIGITPRQLYEFAKESELFKGLLLYDTFVHFDSPCEDARQFLYWRDYTKGQ